MNLSFSKNQWMNSWRMRNVSWLIFWGLHRSSLASIPGRDSFAILPRLFLLIALLAQVFIDKSYSRRIDDVEKETTHGTRSLNRIDDFTRHFWIRRYFFSAEIRKIFTHYCGICGMFCFLVEVTFHMGPYDADLAEKMNQLWGQKGVCADLYQMKKGAI